MSLADDPIKSFLVELGFKGSEAEAKKVVNLAKGVEDAVTKATEEGADKRTDAEQQASKERIGIVAALGKIFVSMEADRVAREEKIKKDAAARDEKLQQEREKKARERRAAALKELQVNAARMATFALGAVTAVEAAALGVVYATDRAAKSMERLRYAAARAGTTPGSMTATGYAFGQLGSTQEAGQAAVSAVGDKLKENPNGYAKVLKSIGVEARKANGELRDAGDIVTDLGEAFARIRKQGPYGYANAKNYAGIVGLDEGQMQTMMDPRFRGMVEEQKRIDAKAGTDRGAAAEGGAKFEQAMRRIEAMADSIRAKVSTSLFAVLTPELDKLAAWVDGHGEQIVKVIDQIATALVKFAEDGLKRLAGADWDAALKDIALLAEKFIAIANAVETTTGKLIAIGTAIEDKVIGPVKALLGFLGKIDQATSGNLGDLTDNIKSALGFAKKVDNATATDPIGAAKDLGAIDQGTSTQGGIWSRLKAMVGLGPSDPDARKVKDAIVATAEGVKKLADKADGVGGAGGGSFGSPSDTGASGAGGPNLRYGRDGSGSYRRGGHGGGGRSYADTPDGRGNAGAVKGSERDRVASAMKYLVEVKGWTPEGAAIAVGNAMQESNVTPNGRPGDPNTPGGSHYMFQWNNGKNNDTVNGRRARYERWMRENNRDANDYRSPLDFMDEERKRRSGLEAQWHTQRDFRNAGRLGHLFEGYGDNSEGTRVQNARDALAIYKSSKTGTPTAQAPVPAGTSAQAVTDAEVFAARQRILNGSRDPADRALVARYLQQQNTPDAAQHLRNTQLVLRARHGNVLPFLHPHAHLSSAARAAIDNSRHRQVSMTHNPTFNIAGGDPHSMLADAHRLAGRGQADMVRNMSVMEA